MGFDEGALKSIEVKLKIEIPPVYRRFLLDFPGSLVTGKETGVFYSVDQIVRSTEASRSYQEPDWPQPFPLNLLAVGWNGGGSIYCVREGEPGNMVYLFSHERGDVDPSETLTLETFIALWGSE
ncbi:hypothetical protein OLMES_0556 [Oleiphilus messinensis]|uniref:Knr4/Smi1-like domain-containing protein n=1 Tax=Oleiphilus messinensis TaxID=141451 RepID=A0A1Y0I379_9GAMM|nr:SMI1/KNR4 family protein [Oleiphilus messinensis]ARU54659.1 hypothetical protein OLMES_0556 [Oleiphilus messinensis]